MSNTIVPSALITRYVLVLCRRSTMYDCALLTGDGGRAVIELPDIGEDGRFSGISISSTSVVSY